MGPDEAEVVARLTVWGEAQGQIRALLLTSSRTNPAAPLDELSDYDVVVVVTNLEPFSNEETWPEGYGTPLVRFRDARVRYGSATRTRLVVYDDGVKIDYQVWPVELLRSLPDQPQLPDSLDLGYRVLLDKDGVTERLPPPTYTAHIPSPPTEEEYLAVVEEFWWETTYVAKNLRRDELAAARYGFEVVIRHNVMRTVLEWSIELDHDWSIRPGAVGRHLKSRLRPELWTAFESTFVGPEIEENWEALFRATALFRDVTRTVAAQFGFEYPEELDRGVTRYLEAIRKL